MEDVNRTRVVRIRRAMYFFAILCGLTSLPAQWVLYGGSENALLYLFIPLSLALAGIVFWLRWKLPPSDRNGA
jgi:hypothetical protein